MKKAITRGIKLYLSLWMTTVCISGCDKEQVIYVSPSIEIESARTTALTAYEVVVKTDKGEGQEIEKVELTFKDITVSSAEDIVMKIELKGEQIQFDTIALRTDRMCHDYSVKAILETNIYIYKSDTKLLRSNKNNFEIDVYPNEKYNDWNNNIATIVNKGDNFSIKVDYEEEFKPMLVEVKLNGTIPVEHTLNFENSSYGDHLETMGHVTIPEDIKEGVYQVFVYLDGIEFKTDSEIKITRGKWQQTDPQYKGDRRGEYVSFVKGDDLYLIGGEIYATQLTESPIWKYNIPGNSWERKKNFPHTGEMSLNRILPFNLQHNNEAYIILKNNKSIEVWKYRDESDEWDFISNYPGKATQYLTSFINNGKLYIGGGLEPSGIFEFESVYDFWEYNLESNVWNQKKDIPIKPYGFKGNLSCTTENGQVFIFTQANELWQYHPDTDSWTSKSKFIGPFRYTTNFIEKNQKLYLIGGSYQNSGIYCLKDCWEYSIESDQWEIVAFMPELYSNGIAFNYKDCIYAGLGWVINGYGSFYEQNLYMLDF